jgi:hypothetical protein
MVCLTGSLNTFCNFGVEALKKPMAMIFLTSTRRLKTLFLSKPSWSEPFYWVMLWTTMRLERTTFLNWITYRIARLRKHFIRLTG